MCVTCMDLIYLVAKSICVLVFVYVSVRMYERVCVLVLPAQPQI